MIQKQPPALPRENLMITSKNDIAVYDPSNYKDGNYWQWTTAPVNADWESIILLINQGWLSKDSTMDKMPDAIRYGLIKSFSALWLYRIYYCGKDRAGRPGRYFILLMKLTAADQILDKYLSGYFRYFDLERSLPLRVPDQNKEIAPGEPDEYLNILHSEHAKHNDSGIHISIDNSKNIVILPPGVAEEVNIQSPRKAEPVSATSCKCIICGCFVILGLLIIVVIMISLLCKSCGYPHSETSIPAPTASNKGDNKKADKEKYEQENTSNTHPETNFGKGAEDKSQETQNPAHDTESKQ